MRLRNNKFSSTISFIILLSFVLTPNVDVSAQLQTPEPEDVIIPENIGKIKEVFKGDSGQLVINIQDAHCNFEAQTNISGILDILCGKYGLKLVALEGSTGEIDPSLFTTFPDEAIRKEVASYFMKTGKINGAEYLAITSKSPPKLFGVETKEYYLANLAAFTNTLKDKKDALAACEKIKDALSGLKERVYSKELRAFDARLDAYKSGKAGLVEFCGYLKELAASKKIDVEAKYKNLPLLYKTSGIEKVIDFNRVENERSEVITLLEKSLAPEDLERLYQNSVNFKSGRISAPKYYIYLKIAARACNIDYGRYPNLSLYTDYLTVYDSIDNAGLFEEIILLEKELKETLFKNEDQRALDKLSMEISLIEAMFNISLSREDVDYYHKNKADFHSSVFVDFINNKARKYRLHFKPDPNFKLIDKSIPDLENFYRIADTRDEAIVENTIGKMNESGLNMTALIAGGYHTDGVTRRLRDRGISYIVVSPRITKPDTENPYLELLSKEKIPSSGTPQRQPGLLALTSRLPGNEMGLGGMLTEKDLVEAADKLKRRDPQTTASSSKIVAQLREQGVEIIGDESDILIETDVDISGFKAGRIYAGARITGKTKIGNGCEIEGAVRNSVIAENVKILGASEVENVTVGKGSRILTRSKVVNTYEQKKAAGKKFDSWDNYGPLYTVREQPTVIGEDCIIDGGAYVENSTVGNRSKIYGGSTTASEIGEDNKLYNLKAHLIHTEFGVVINPMYTGEIQAVCEMQERWLGFGYRYTHAECYGEGVAENAVVTPNGIYFVALADQEGDCAVWSSFHGTGKTEGQDVVSGITDTLMKSSAHNSFVLHPLSLLGHRVNIVGMPHRPDISVCGQPRITAVLPGSVVPSGSHVWGSILGERSGQSWKDENPLDILFIKEPNLFARLLLEALKFEKEHGQQIRASIERRKQALEKQASELDAQGKSEEAEKLRKLAQSFQYKPLDSEMIPAILRGRIALIDNLLQEGANAGVEGEVEKKLRDARDEYGKYLENETWRELWRIDENGELVHWALDERGNAVPKNRNAFISAFVETGLVDSPDTWRDMAEFYRPYHDEWTDNPDSYKPLATGFEPYKSNSNIDKSATLFPFAHVTGSEIGSNCKVGARVSGVRFCTGVTVQHVNSRVYNTDLPDTDGVPNASNLAGGSVIGKLRGRRVVLHPGCFVRTNAIIGEGCEIGDLSYIVGTLLADTKLPPFTLYQNGKAILGGVLDNPRLSFAFIGRFGFGYPIRYAATDEQRQKVNFRVEAKLVELAEYILNEIENRGGGDPLKAPLRNALDFIRSDLRGEKEGLSLRERSEQRWELFDSVSGAITATKARFSEKQEVIELLARLKVVSDFLQDGRTRMRDGVLTDVRWVNESSEPNNPRFKVQSLVGIRPSAPARKPEIRREPEAALAAV